MKTVRFLSAWGPVVGWMGIIFLLSGRPALQEEWGLWFYLVRKLAHMAEYAILAALLFRAHQKSWPNQSLVRMAVASGGIALIYAATDEIHQRYVPGREGAFRDVMIDAGGILLLLLWRLSKERQGHRKRL